MKEFGFFKDGQLVERFDSLDEAFKPYKESVDRSGCVFRRLRFDELTEEERLIKMESRLKDLTNFLNMAKGTGRMIQSHTQIYEEELEWLLSFARKEVKAGQNSGQGLKEQ